MFISRQMLDSSVNMLVYPSSSGVVFEHQAHLTLHRDQCALLQSLNHRYTPIVLEWRERQSRGEGTREIDHCQEWGRVFKSMVDSWTEKALNHLRQLDQVFANKHSLVLFTSYCYCSCHCSLYLPKLMFTKQKKKNLKKNTFLIWFSGLCLLSLSNSRSPRFECPQLTALLRKTHFKYIFMGGQSRSSGYKIRDW